MYLQISVFLNINASLLLVGEPVPMHTQLKCGSLARPLAKAAVEGYITLILGMIFYLIIEL